VWVFFGYFCFALAAQLVIRRRIRRIRLALAIGIVDLLFVTFLVQLLGSTHSVLSFLYLLIPIVFATTTARRRISMTLAVVGALAYLTVLVMEWLGVIPYASALPGQPRPPAVMLFFSGLFVTIAIVTATRFVSQLIAALREANARLQEQSQRDDLTGLYNRRYMHVRLEAELARVQRGGKLMLMMVDLDGFKRVNDEEGHDVGDAVLAAVARALIEATRRVDVVARYGGDEFVILLPDTELEGARAVSARVLDHARAAARGVCPAIPVSASIGMTTLRPTDDPAEVIRRVDEQLYAAKRAGGDRVSVA
jgi:diguanylate cyclase (GGDEF)-like protein